MNSKSKENVKIKLYFHLVVLQLERYCQEFVHYQARAKQKTHFRDLNYDAKFLFFYLKNYRSQLFYVLRFPLWPKKQSKV